jgi:hypothetical protein
MSSRGGRRSGSTGRLAVFGGRSGRGRGRRDVRRAIKIFPPLLHDS